MSDWDDDTWGGEDAGLDDEGSLLLDDEDDGDSDGWDDADDDQD